MFKVGASKMSMVHRSLVKIERQRPLPKWVYKRSNKYLIGRGNRLVSCNTLSIRRDSRHLKEEAHCIGFQTKFSHNFFLYDIYENLNFKCFKMGVYDNYL